MLKRIHKKMLSGLLAVLLCFSGATPALADRSVEHPTLGESSSSGSLGDSSNPELTLGASSVITRHGGNYQGEWESRAFGQSTDLNFTSTVPGGYDGPYADKVGVNQATVQSDGSVVIESRGGKITTAHDGLTYYYATLDPNTDNFELSAVLSLEQYGPLDGSKLNGQEGFGMMVRDAIGPARQDPFNPAVQEIPSSSNFVMTGAVGGSQTGVTLSASYRRGVVGVDKLVGISRENQPVEGALELGINASGTVNNSTDVKVTMGRDQNGFYTQMSRPDGSNATDKVYFDYEICPPHFLQQQDPNHMYVGFFASRNAQLRVSDIQLNVTADYVAPDPLPPLWTPDNNDLKPMVKFLSGNISSTADYILTAYPSDAGTLVVTKEGGDTVFSGAVSQRETVAIPVTLNVGKNKFSATFTADEAYGGTDTATADIEINYAANSSLHDLKNIYVSPSGSSSAAGTEADPTDLNTALASLAQGGTIYLLDGVYSGGLGLNPKYSGGAEDALKTVTAAPGAEPRFVDGNLAAQGNFWKIVGIDFSGGSGSSITGNFNQVERCTFHDCSNTGLQLGGGGKKDVPYTWPSYNLVKNCTSYGNRDNAEANADGFAPKLGVGYGNVFDGCIAYGNIDDGYDLYNKVENGANAPITLINCIAYGNGIWVNPEDPSDVRYGKGGGNGFKVGGEGMAVAHVIKNNIAFNNYMAGFSDNFNPGALVVENNTALDNMQQNFIFRENALHTPEGVYRNNLSVRTTESNWIDSITGDYDETNFLYNGDVSTNGSVVVSIDDFLSLEVPESYQRESDGSIRYGDFLRYTARSPLARAGSGETSYVGALPPDNSAAPSDDDGGSGSESSVDQTVDSIRQNSGSTSSTEYDLSTSPWISRSLVQAQRDAGVPITLRLGDGIRLTIDEPISLPQGWYRIDMSHSRTSQFEAQFQQAAGNVPYDVLSFPNYRGSLGGTVQFRVSVPDFADGTWLYIYRYLSDGQFGLIGYTRVSGGEIVYNSDSGSDYFFTTVRLPNAVNMMGSTASPPVNPETGGEALQLMPESTKTIEPLQLLTPSTTSASSISSEIDTPVRKLAAEAEAPEAPSGHVTTIWIAVSILLVAAGAASGIWYVKKQDRGIHKTK